MSNTKKKATQSRDRIPAVLIALILLCGPSSALATPSWSFEITEHAFFGFLFPTLTLTNLSTAGEQINGFSISVGEPGYYFDFIWDSAANLATEAQTGATLVLGDRTNDNSGVTVIEWSFTDFDVGESLSFRVDVDPGWDANVVEILLNNSSGTNSELSLEFEDVLGQTVSEVFTLPDVTSPSGTIPFTPPPSIPTPEPGAGILLSFGLVMLVVERRNAL